MSTSVGNTLIVQTVRAASVFRPSRVSTSLVLLASDSMAWAAAIAMGVGVASVSGPLAVTEQLLLAILAILLTLGTYARAGLYPAAGIDHVEELRRLTLRTTGVWLPLTAAVAVALGAGAVYPWLAAWAFGLVAVPTARSLVRSLYADRPWYGVPVVILGNGAATASLLRRLERLAGGMHRPVAILDDDPAHVGSRVEGVPVVGPLSQAPSFAAQGVRHAFVSLPAVLANEHVPDAGPSASIFPYVYVLPNLVAPARMGASTIGRGGAVRVHGTSDLVNRGHLLVKRTLDLAIAVPAALVAAPIVLATAAVVWIVSPGNPFFAHEREGLGGQTFRMWKLRTMYRDAGERLERYLAADPEAAAEWASRFKLARDPRILPAIGRFLRVTSLDELPQLWNIIRGDMSLVGPRPFPRYHLDAFSREFRSLRHSVRPGLTGLWQITARADADLALQEELDSMYVNSWSVWLDVYLLARTPWAVVRGGGAY